MGKDTGTYRVIKTDNNNHKLANTETVVGTKENRRIQIKP